MGLLKLFVSALILVLVNSNCVANCQELHGSDSQYSSGVSQQPRNYVSNGEGVAAYQQAHVRNAVNQHSGYSAYYRTDYYDPRATCSSHFGQSGTCKPLVSCSIHYTRIVDALQTPCYLPDGMVGVCCQDQSPAPYPPNNEIILDVKGKKKIRFPNISPYEVTSAVKSGQRAVQKVQLLQEELFRQNIVVPRETSASYHQKFFTTTQRALDQGVGASKNLEACKTLVNRFSLSKDQALFGLPTLSVMETDIASTCPSVPNCNTDTRYRAIDGSCNNLQNPNWGRARTAMQRILEPDYADGHCQHPGMTVLLDPGSRSVKQEKIMYIDISSNYFTNFGQSHLVHKIYVQKE
ncbi:unnamed protein product [Notodromas monacha]|uniref:Uncharacterized protein n=1 Tax=Notodromas monacha TaxID=399045 RepID=A0A7R9BH88_9CRUS|nr:unnamed protein product [Notodromas monacha]CAG0915451.1 unnamed protein product [Notodromas monacha]